MDACTELDALQLLFEYYTLVVITCPDSPDFRNRLINKRQNKYLPKRLIDPNQLERHLALNIANLTLFMLIGYNMSDLISY